METATIPEKLDRLEEKIHNLAIEIDVIKYMIEKVLGRLGDKHPHLTRPILTDTEISSLLNRVDEDLEDLDENLDDLERMYTDLKDSKTGDK